MAMSLVRIACFVLTTSTALFASGCSDGLFDRPVNVDGTSYDAQGCAEHALRNHPDPQAVRASAVAFTRACDDGEAAACSALGVIYEVGLGVAPDPSRAQFLYEAACTAHNRRGCMNLRALHEQVAIVSTNL
jgi:TPR repeat protein